MKGQIVADFIVDHAIVKPSLNMADTNLWRLYFDGWSHKNGTRVGILILSPQDIPTKFKCKVDGKCSNNEVEYEALTTGLKILRDLEAKKVEIKGVSKLVIRQITREYKCIKENPWMYFTMETHLLECFEVVSITHVPKMENQEATELAKISYGYNVSKEKLNEFIEVKENMVSNFSPSPKMTIPKTRGHMSSVIIFFENFETFERQKVFAINNLSQSDGRNQS